MVDDSKVTTCNDDSSIPKHIYTFTPLDQVATINNNSTIDVIGIVISVDPSSTIRKRDGTEVPRHTIMFTLDKDLCISLLYLLLPLKE